MINNIQLFKKSAVFLALSSTITIPNYVTAEESSLEGIERIQVTASRRASTVQDAPLNITALDSDVMKDQNIGKLTEIARWVPGLSIPDQGGRSENNIIVRGLSTNSTGSQSDGGTVATYFGEIPLDVDVRLIDVERVEVLIGPQGTLYGAGTLGGAIRYIPKKAELDVTSVELSGDFFKGTESDSLGHESSIIVNVPLIEDTLAVRASFNLYKDPGFIDYAYTVREGGVSTSDPDWSNSADVERNIRPVKDANGEKVFTSRIALRWTPLEWLDGTLTYFYQDSNVEGRTVSNYQTLGAGNPLRDLVGKYESAERYLEPDESKDSLISLEVVADLGFAELVSSTGYSEHENEGQRDQTDFLYTIDYGYESFPTFSAFSRDTDDFDSFIQEVRLVSTLNSDLSWIVGGYYNKTNENALSEEYTPHHPFSNRNDDLEYLGLVDDEIVEKALFGELSYQFTEAFNATFGVRLYQYDIKIASVSTIPFVHDDRYIPFDSLTFNPEDLNRTSSDGDGSLFKINMSYKFTDDVMAYATISEGFRLGGSNGIAACPEVDPMLCALPDEVSYEPDTTTNYELGFKSTWLNNQLHFNASIFYVGWEGAQVSGAATVNGGLAYTSNAGTATSQGIEISSRAMISNNLTVFTSYAYAKAELTSNVFGFFKRLDKNDPTFDEVTDPAYLEYSALDGDRLPGSPEHQLSIGLNYSQEVFDDKLLNVNYGITAQSDIYSSAGLRSEGEALPGYALSNLSASISDDEWSVTLYVDNLFDKFAFSSTRGSSRAAGFAEFPGQIGNADTTDLYRAYTHYVVAPRTIGLKLNYLFDM